jgi:hypothetical protein
MKTRQWLYFAAFILIIAGSSCKKNKLEQAKHIPKDVNFVLAIQPDQLYNKLKDNKDLLDSTINQLFTESMATVTGSAAANKQSSASEFFNSIDSKQPIFLFQQTKNSIAEGDAMLAGMVIPLSDADKFTDFVKNNVSEVVSQGNGYSFGMFKNSSIGIVGWNNKLAIFMGYTGDSSSVPAQLETLFNLKESESLAGNSSFTSSYDAQSDMSFFLNSSQALVAAPFLAMTKAGDFVKGSYTAGSINFNNGSIDIQSKYYPSTALQDLVNKNPSTTLDGKTLNNYPGKLQGMMDFSVNPKLLVGIIQYMGLDEMISPFLQKQGLTLDDIAAVFKGEIAAGMSNFSSDPNNNSTQYLVCLPLASKAAYDKIINTLAKNEPDMFVNKNGQLIPLVLAQNPNAAAYSADNNNLLIASSQEIIDNFTAGKNTATQPDDIAKNLKGKTAYFYGDLQSILGGIPANTDSKDSETIVIVKRALKDFSAWGGATTGKAYTGEAHIRFMDEKQNSLVSVLTMIKDWKTVQNKYDLINGILQKDTLLSPPSPAAVPTP